jgi:hypothetical protein
LSPVTPADPDVTQAAPARPADEPADPDATTVLKPGRRDDDGDATQRTQAIPPSN